MNEGNYTRSTLELLAAHDRCLFTVDIKGTTPENYEANTRKKFNEDRFWSNLFLLKDSGVNFYLTFTNPDMRHYGAFCEKLVRELGPSIMDDAFTISLVNYNATPYVDIRPIPVTAIA